MKENRMNEARKHKKHKIARYRQTQRKTENLRLSIQFVYVETGKKSAAQIQFFSLSLVFRARRCSSISSICRRVIFISFSINLFFSLFTCQTNPYRPHIILYLLFLVLLFAAAAAVAVVTVLYFVHFESYLSSIYSFI